MGPADRAGGQHAHRRARSVRGDRGAALGRPGPRVVADRPAVAGQRVRPGVRRTAAVRRPGGGAAGTPPDLSGRARRLRRRLRGVRADERAVAPCRHAVRQGLLRRAHRPHRAGHHRRRLPRGPGPSPGGLGLRVLRRRRLHLRPAAVRTAHRSGLAVGLPLPRPRRTRPLRLRGAARPRRRTPPVGTALLRRGGRRVLRRTAADARIWNSDGGSGRLVRPADDRSDRARGPARRRVRRRRAVRPAAPGPPRRAAERHAGPLDGGRRRPQRLLSGPAAARHGAPPDVPRLVALADGAGLSARRALRWR